MYTPPYYRIDDVATIHAFIMEHSFATVVTASEGHIVTTHIPVEIEGDPQGQWTLVGHVSRANPHWRAFAGSTDTVVMFMGPHAYISSSRYEQPNVPTWNYTAVHCRGTIALIDNDEVLRQSLRTMMQKYESPSSGLTFDTLPEHVINQQIRGIVGFTITVETVEAKFKLSQNRSARDYETIIHQLDEGGSASEREVVAYMHKHSPFL